MKRISSYFFGLAMSLLLISLTGCSNDDIDITTLGDVELRISTQNLYDQFGSTQSIKSRFLNEEYAIGVYAYIYDEAGRLVAERSDFQKTFGNLSMSFQELETGNYKVVIVETLVDTTEDNTSKDWKVEGTENLSSLHIENNKESNEHFWYSVVGSSVKDFSIELGTSVKIDLMPTGLGTVMECFFLNFSTGPYPYASLDSKDIPIGRYLSKEYTGSDRFIFDQYNESRTWSSRGYAWLEDEGDDVGSDLYFIEAGPTTVCFAPHARLNDGTIDGKFFPCPSGGVVLNLKDGDTLYAGCYYKGLGDVYNGCESAFTETFEALQEWYNSLATTTRYAVPYLTWGANASTVVNYMTQYGFSNPTISEVEDGYDYLFSSNDKSFHYLYSFNLNKSNLNQVNMWYDSDIYSLSDVLSFSEDYFGMEGIYDDELNGYLFWNDLSVNLVMNSVNGLFQTIYLPNTINNSPKKSIIRQREFSTKTTPTFLIKTTPKKFNINSQNHHLK